MKSFFLGPLRKISGKTIPDDNQNKILSNENSLKMAALIIDMQLDFLDKVPRKRRDQIVENQIKIIKLCAQKDIPLFILEYQGHGKTISKLRREIKRVRIKKTIIKKNDDGFLKTNLALKLKRLGITQVLLMGINASACVQRTGGGAIKNGFNIITSKKLIADPWHLTQDDMSWFKKNGLYRKGVTFIVKMINN